LSPFLPNHRALCRSLYLDRKFFFLFSSNPYTDGVLSKRFVILRPGTGKTITVIECINQLLAKYPRAKVLACAPSNSAADLIASRLQRHLSTDELFRFYAPSRFKEQVPDGLRPYIFTSDGHFSVPPMGRLENFKVVVSTCVSASVFSGIGMARGHFTHIFIDEAGQATEPETFVSIKMLADSKTNVILSGDPKQLGPVIQSSIAKGLGLEKSYLERLMDRDAYNIEVGHGRR
jgi:helicase MOV-10